MSEFLRIVVAVSPEKHQNVVKFFLVSWSYIEILSRSGLSMQHCYHSKSYEVGHIFVFVMLVCISHVNDSRFSAFFII